MNIRFLSARRKICAVFAVAWFLPVIAQATQTGWMRGGNWADARDNYVDGWIIPSGLTASSTTAEAASKAHQIALDIKGITDSSGCIVRMGINPPSVRDDFWWARITACVDQLNADGVDVILACWESPTAKDGLIDNPADWKSMWQTVQGKYGNNSRVWFEPFNEPYGYSVANLISLYTDYLSWIGKSPDHIVLGGSGYSENVGTIGGSFPLCKLGLHIYPWYGSYTTESSWMSAVVSRIGGYQDRTLITEMGAPATTGLNFGATSSDVNVAFIRGVTEQARAYSIGLCYWPSHRDGDSYRLFSDTSGGGFTNTSLKDRLSYGWNIDSVAPAAPTDLAASAGIAQVSLTWSASRGATRYNVKRATVDGGPYTTVGSVTTTSYLNTDLVSGTTYYYVVSSVNPSGESTNSSQVSAAPVGVAPTITTQPVSQVITTGSSVTFTVAASGSPTPTFQWFKETTSIAGATSTSYPIDSASSSDDGSYSVMISNSAGSVTSNPAVLTVIVPPSEAVITIVVG